MIIARGIIIKPRAYLILLRGHFVTIVANPKEPTAAQIYMIHKNLGSQSTEAVKINASKITGNVSPTFRVPGISISSIWLKSLYMNVDGAKEPQPSVSKKLATIPTAKPDAHCLPVAFLRPSIRFLKMSTISPSPVPAASTPNKICSASNINFSLQIF